MTVHAHQHGDPNSRQGRRHRYQEHDHQQDRHDHGHGNGHENDHGHGEHEHIHAGGLRGFVQEIFRPHSHDHGDLAADRAFAENEVGIRTVWLALAALTITSLLQIAIVLASGSVALLADTAHNIGDGLNSIPLLIAFYLARRAATVRFTYGYGRAEDVAGIVIVLSILISAGIVFWESFQRLFNPQPLEAVGWVAAAALIGFLGNEFVALLQIRVGRRIGSAALVADGLHARTDGLTSLAVLLAAGGAWFGFPLIDPVVGLLIGVAILIITWDATRRIWYRLMDAVEPELMAQVRGTIEAAPGVNEVERLRLRWIGHQLQGDVRLTVAAGVDAAPVKEEVRHRLAHAVPKLVDLTVETEGALHGSVIKPARHVTSS